MISSASTLLLATLVFNAASVFGAPIKYPNADLTVRAEITEPLVPRVHFASSREVPEVRDTVPAPVEKREASTEDSSLPRRFPRRVYHDFYQKRADPVEPPVARAPKPDSERRFPRRVYHDLYAERADTPVARAEKPEHERRYPRRVLYEKRNNTPAPAVPTAVANSTDTTTVIKNFIDSTTNQTLPAGTTIKETTVLMNKVTYVSDKNGAPAPPSNQCNQPPAVSSSIIPSGTPTAASSIASATGTIVPTTAADPAATPSSAVATGTLVPTSSVESATATSASATGTIVPTSAADPAATPSSVTSSSNAQPTPAAGSASPSAPAAEVSATTTTAGVPAASTPATTTNSRRSLKEVSNEPVAREPEPEAMPSSDKSEPLKRTSGPLVPREPAPAPAPVERSSGPVEAREPAPPAPLEGRTRGPLLPRRLGFSGAALASLARRSNHH